VNLVVKTARIVRAEPEADPLGALVRPELLEEIKMPPKRKRKTVRIPVAPSMKMLSSTSLVKLLDMLTLEILITSLGSLNYIVRVKRLMRLLPMC
jgi:hypothetical protein